VRNSGDVRRRESVGLRKKRPPKKANSETKSEQQKLLSLSLSHEK